MLRTHTGEVEETSVLERHLTGVGEKPRIISRGHPREHERYKKGVSVSGKEGVSEEEGMESPLLTPVGKQEILNEDQPDFCARCSGSGNGLLTSHSLFWRYLKSLPCFGLILSICLKKPKLIGCCPF